MSILIESDRHRSRPREVGVSPIGMTRSGESGRSLRRWSLRHSWFGVSGVGLAPCSPIALDSDGGADAVQACEVVIGEGQQGGSEVLLEAVELAGPWDGDD